LRDGVPRVPAAAVRPPLAAAAVGAHFAHSGSYEREPRAPARFVPGDRVRFRNINPRGHTRLPRYARGHDARIERIHGCHPFPDSNALGQGESPQWLYAVTLDHSALGYSDAEAGDVLVLDAWEPYLEPTDR